MEVVAFCHPDLAERQGCHCQHDGSCKWGCQPIAHTSFLPPAAETYTGTRKLHYPPPGISLPHAMTILSPEQFFGFLSASLLITLSPGPDNLLVLSIGASKGRKLGMAFGLGCGIGCLSHTFLAALGISALIAASPLAFMGLKLVGGAYLFIWAGKRYAAKAVSMLNKMPVLNPQRCNCLAKGCSPTLSTRRL